MKQYERKIDELGRIAIPAEVRSFMNIDDKSKVSLTVQDNSIVITPNTTVCAICGKPIAPGAEFNLCPDCIQTVREDGEDISSNAKYASVRRIDELGRIVIPNEIRHVLHLGKTSTVILEVDDGRLIIKPIVNICANCGSIIPLGKKYRLCDKCVREIRKKSSGEVPKVFYQHGRFYISPISFALPDQTYVSTVTEVEIENGIAFMSADQRTIVVVMANDVAESAKESIDSIFDSETGHKKLSEIENVLVAGFNGYQVMYENSKTVNIECCFDIKHNPDAQALTVWAYTDKQFGEDAITDMRAIYNMLMADIKLAV